ncbi:GNAT family N-acetyltransferase [Paenibacillus phocaensis]|uniref:GNAT family N-acetyltransferase n=1 Tax=Paenibacillus phocaensis TaxID=1776378 RepID=UPI000839D6B1|nr:GNAT family N-acetyltransferase [Paenibacillus phocaensis]
MGNASPQNHPILNDVERMIHLETELTQFNHERSLYLAESARLTVTRIGGTTLLLDASSPASSYYNRVIGFGPADLDRLPEILGTYTAAGIDPCFDMSPDRQTGEVAEVLAARGFVPRLQLAFLKLERIGENLEQAKPAQAQARKDIAVSRVADEAGALSLIQLIERSRGGDGSALEEAKVQQKSRYFYRADFQNYVAWIGGEPAGIGSLFIRRETGYLANDFTFPEHRRQGVQTALIRHRLQAASALGLTRVYTDVEFASASHVNMLRCGFEMVYMNTFWMKSASPL